MTIMENNEKLDYEPDLKLHFGPFLPFQWCKEAKRLAPTQPHGGCRGTCQERIKAAELQKSSASTLFPEGQCQLMQFKVALSCV